MTYAIVGAGAAGLAAAKNLKEHGIPCEVLERESDVGGIWDISHPQSPVYRSTHLISSKPLTEYPDFPMPAHYPDYPNHKLALEYLKSYAQHYNLYDLIRFNTTVEKIHLNEDQTWEVKLASGTSKTYAGLIVASGFLWDPNLPDIPGNFSGQIIHSKQYKSPDVLAGKRVLIMGAGNSGCDIAVESSQHADKTYFSVRRGYHYIPKYIFGKPADQFAEVALELGLPLFLRRLLDTLLLKVVAGNPASYGLPKPDHRLLESHPIVNSLLLYYLGQGDILAKPDVKEFRGKKVVFKDDSEEEIDLVIAATGFRPTISYLDKSYLNFRSNHPDLYLHFCHRRLDNLFVLGLIQADSGVWWLFDLQTRIIAKSILAQTKAPEKFIHFRRLKSAPPSNLGHGLQYLKTPRHTFEVEHYSYKQRLKKLERLLDFRTF